MNCSECGEIPQEIVRVQHRRCADVAERRLFKQTGKLSTSLMMSAQLNVMRAGVHVWGVDDDINAAVERLKIDVKRFEVEAWFGGVNSTVCTNKNALGSLALPRLVYPRTKESLQSVVEDSPHRTVAAKLADIDVTGQEMAGRALVELESKEARITLICAAGEQAPRMGIQGVDGTEAEFRRMLNEVRRGWRGLKFEAVK